MLTDRTSNLHSLVERRYRLRTQVNRLEALRSRTHQVEAAASQLVQLATAAGVLRLRGDLGSLHDHAIESLRRIVKEWADQFRNDPDGFLDGATSTLGGRRHQFEANAVLIKNSLEATWSTFVGAVHPPLPPGLLSLLGGLPAFREVVDSLKRANSEIEEIGRNLPADARVLERLDELVRQIKESWVALGGSDVSTEVVRFLVEATSAAGGPLGSLTEQVSSWIDSHNLRGDFSIIVRRRG